LIGVEAQLVNDVPPATPATDSTLLRDNTPPTDDGVQGTNEAQGNNSGQPGFWKGLLGDALNGLLWGMGQAANQNANRQAAQASANQKVNRQVNNAPQQAKSYTCTSFTNPAWKQVGGNTVGGGQMPSNTYPCTQQEWQAQQNSKPNH
jgi:hypothetical protein